MGAVHSRPVTSADREKYKRRFYYDSKTVIGFC